jgi:hypothetical protein
LNNYLFTLTEYYLVCACVLTEAGSPVPEEADVKLAFERLIAFLKKNVA